RSAITLGPGSGPRLQRRGHTRRRDAGSSTCAPGAQTVCDALLRAPRCPRSVQVAATETGWPEFRPGGVERQAGSVRGPAALAGARLVARAAAGHVLDSSSAPDSVTTSGRTRDRGRRAPEGRRRASADRPLTRGDYRERVR